MAKTFLWLLVLFKFCVATFQYSEMHLKRMAIPTVAAVGKSIK